MRGLIVNERLFTINPVARPRTRTDEEILDATQRVVAMAGPDRTTLAAVAREVGLSPSTLVQRFGSKRALLAAMARYSVASAPEAMAPVRVARERDPVEALVTALGTAGLARLATGPARMANQVAMLQRDLEDPELHAAAAAHARAVRGRIAEILAGFVARGALGPGAGDPAVARAVQVAANGSLIAWAIEPEGGLDALLRTQLEAVVGPYRAGGGPGGAPQSA